MSMSATASIVNYFTDNEFGRTSNADLEVLTRYSCLNQPKWAQCCNSENKAEKTQFTMFDLCQNKMYTENTSI